MADGGKTDQWRAVLGEYPTGVALITSLGADGEAVGMVVGTFTAVSQTPPLVGFLPDTTSTTYPLIADHGRFVVSVLGSEHEGLCRAFASKDPDRFALGSFVPSPSGIPRLVDAVAWFEARIDGSDPYGDHRFVVGEVEDFGVGTADAGLPMLFRRAGYGVFAIPADDLDSGTLGHRLAAADEATEVLASLADALGRQVVVSTVVHDSVVVLAAVRPEGDPARPGRRRVGDTFPLAAPIAPLFVAWASPKRQTAWIEGARHLVGAVDRPALAGLLADVRRRGFGVSAGRALADRFDTVVGGAGPRRESFARLWSDIAAERQATAGGEREADGAAAVQAPVFGASGDVVLVITVALDGGPQDGLGTDALAAVMLTAADRVTARLGGSVPARDAPAARAGLEGAAASPTDPPGAPHHGVPRPLKPAGRWTG